MIRLILIFSFLLAVLPSYADIDDFERVVADPVDNLIYPQQLIVGSDGNFYILDNISNSSHLKIYSKLGEFLSGIIPAGVGKDSAKFDLGLTMVSGKNILSIDESGLIYILDSEDGIPVIKSFDQVGTLKNGVVMGLPIIEGSYGSVNVDGDRIYVEYRDEVLIRNLPLKAGFERFTGRRGEPIDNWDACGGYFLALTENQLTIMNDKAIPISTMDVSKILGKEGNTVDVFDISISVDGHVAITGSIINGDGEKPFLAVCNRFGTETKEIYPEKFVTSLDWSKSGTLYAMIVDEKLCRITNYDSELSELSAVNIELREPALAHPSKIGLSSDGAIWVDNQSDKSSTGDPFTLIDSNRLFLKRFDSGTYSQIEMDSLGGDRFGSFFLGNIGKEIILSGIRTDQDGFPILTPMYSLSNEKDEIRLSKYNDFQKLVLCSLATEDKEIFLDPEDGSVWIGSLKEGKIVEPKKVPGFTQDEGIPSVFPVTEKKVIMQVQGNEESESKIKLMDFGNGKEGDSWKASEYADLRLLYSCNDGTVVAYWFPQGLLRISEDFRILAWMNLGDDAAYDFTDGCHRDGKNYVLDSRFNLVYSFDDDSWEKIKWVSVSDVRSAANNIRSMIAVYYSMKRQFPERMNDLTDSGFVDERELKDAFEFFIGEAPVSYIGTKFGFTLILWGKDEDNTIFEINMNGMKEY